MQKQGQNKRIKCLHWMLYALFFISLLIIVILTFRTYYPNSFFSVTSERCGTPTAAIPSHLSRQISNLQARVGFLLEQLHAEKQEAKAFAKFSDQVLRIAVSLDKLAVSLSSNKLIQNPPSWTGEASHVDEDYSVPEETETEEEGSGSGSNWVYSSGELRNYTSPKPNRVIGKKNFLGVEEINPSIGTGCARVAAYLDRFMKYKLHGMCPDDSELARKLIAGGCDPLPRRRCFSRAPSHYTDSFLGVESSLWAQPSDTNIIWSHYKCKNYSCLVSPETIDRRGFFKCSDCFNLSRRGWEATTNANESAEFTIDQVLSLKPGKIRIGLDFSPTTGTFAALMRARNVTIVSATMNLGAPFNEVIALRGLIPLHVSVGSRLPFYDNTLDMVHSNLFLDGWIGVELLQFVLLDWDRVLRPRGLLWIDRFFCEKGEVEMYVGEFNRLGYRRLLWRMVPKTDKAPADEVFFSAVLEKPVRP